MSDVGRELFNLAADFESATPEMMRNASKALQVTARTIKDQWAKEAAVEHGGLTKALPRAIDYSTPKQNTAFGGVALEVEIGPNLSKKGGSGGFLEEAPGGVKAAPQFAGRDAVEAAAADFLHGLDIAGLKPLEG